MSKLILPITIPFAKRLDEKMKLSDSTVFYFSPSDMTLIVKYLLYMSLEGTVD